MPSLLIRNGRIIDPANDTDRTGDLLLCDGKVTAFDPTSEQAAAAERTISAEGLLVCPGLIDAHVSVREPGFEEDETTASAGAAALAGGFTRIAANPDTNPVADNRGSAEFIQLLGERAGQARVHSLGAVTKGTRGEELAEIGQLVEGGAVAFTDGKAPIANAEVMRRALEYTRMFDRAILHFSIVPELADGGVMHEGIHSTRLGLRGIPAAAQDIMTSRDIALAELTGGRVHLMCVSTAGAVQQLQAAQERGVRVTADVTPHHLLLNDSVMQSFDTLAKCLPPLRSEDHVQALIDGLRSGTISVISADHQPLAIEKKAVELDVAPFGISGLETVIPLCIEALIGPGHLSWSSLIRCLTTGPAELLSLKDAGTLSPGVPADVTLIDPDHAWTIQTADFRSQSRNSPFDGRKATGCVVGTIVGGELRYSTELLKPRQTGSGW